MGAREAQPGAWIQNSSEKHWKGRTFRPSFPYHDAEGHPIEDGVAPLEGR